jgi:diadenosine tetraphosphate (Ap4A) HIT family hydrolase
VSGGCGLCSGTELVGPPVDRGEWAVGVLREWEVPGWLALYPRRHVEWADELTAAEAADVGRELAALTAALRAAVPSRRVYTVSFGERIAHWHLLLMAVPPGVAAERRGPGLFAAREQWRDEAAAGEVAAAVGRLLNPGP